MVKKLGLAVLAVVLVLCGVIAARPAALEPASIIAWRLVASIGTRNETAYTPGCPTRTTDESREVPPALMTLDRAGFVGSEALGTGRKTGGSGNRIVPSASKSTRWTRKGAFSFSNSMRAGATPPFEMTT